MNTKNTLVIQNKFLIPYYDGALLLCSHFAEEVSGTKCRFGQWYDSMHPRVEITIATPEYVEEFDSWLRNKKVVFVRVA